MFQKLAIGAAVAAAISASAFAQQSAPTGVATSHAGILSGIPSTATDVAVPFNAVHATQKNGSWYLTMNATKDALKGAPGYKYDKAKANWVPA
jgi:hypothetical protein